MAPTAALTGLGRWLQRRAVADVLNVTTEHVHLSNAATLIASVDSRDTESYNDFYGPVQQAKAPWNWLRVLRLAPSMPRLWRIYQVDTAGLWIGGGSLPMKKLAKNRHDEFRL